jgi:hypothetical protein
MAERPPKPIRSLREDEPEVEERLERFILSLGEQVDRLQDDEVAGDLGALERHAGEFEAQARELGYPPLADAAARIRSACSEGSSDAALKAVRGLTDLAQRVRRGHRGAA